MPELAVARDFGRARIDGIVRHLSPSIAPKQYFSTVDLTVKTICIQKKALYFRVLRALETIEWE